MDKEIEDIMLPKNKNFPLFDSNQFPAVVPLNVGGVRFTTRLSTLCKYQDSMLAAMFSGRHSLDKDTDGCYFIDSRGGYFSYILDFLRHETLPPNDLAEAIYKEALYYGLDTLAERLETTPALARQIVRESHRSQFPDYHEVKQKIIKLAIEKATVTKVADVFIHPYRLEFVPKAANFNVSHNCVDDLADIRIGPWEAAADEDTLMRCLEQDFQDAGFNVKLPEPKRKCKYYYGQTCQKFLYKLQFNFL